MDPDILVTIGLGPFYAAAVAATWWGLNYGWHKLQELSQSAQQTQLQSTTSPPAQMLPQASAGTTTLPK
jgi:hypothetical protein